jgi:TM2 domain-containing membrane protein YozV
MPFRFRKSINLGGGVRLNLSKSGIGMSAGVKGFRVGIGPRGGRISASIPGTGIGYSTGFWGKRRAGRTLGAVRVTSARYSPSVTTDYRRKSILLAYVLWFLGVFGAHRFYLGRPISGLVMLGLFIAGLGAFPPLMLLLIGWLFIDLFLIPSMARV